MLDVKVFERIEMISVVLQLGRAHVEMGLIPYREINSSIVGQQQCSSCSDTIQFTCTTEGIEIV